ncbi:MAG TPA: hypothetical protein VFN45_12590, partial [Myxococcaceae bacterium]|nr:hypothetical protein [Myxococcaceae bacterium]
ALRTAAGVVVGDPVTMVIAPTATRKAYLAALEQSAVTTQPGKPRQDAVGFLGTENSRRIRSGRAGTRRPARRR